MILAFEAPQVSPALSRAPQRLDRLLFVICSGPLDSACCPRGPVSRGTPLVDEGPALTSPVLDVVLAIGTILTLSVTRIFTIQETIFSWCSSCSALVF